MSSDGRDRNELQRDVVEAVKRIRGMGIMLTQAVADRIGLHPSDVLCLGYLRDGGGMPAGKLADVLGLTTGAVTRMIDRLEGAGFVERVTDSQDRRRVIVRTMTEKAAHLAPFFDGIETVLAHSLSGYSKAELALILDFLTQTQGTIRERIHAMREHLGADASPTVGRVHRAHLVFPSGTVELTLKAEALDQELYRARFKAGAPEIRFKDGTVSVANRAGGPSPSKMAGELALNQSVAWRIDLRRGSSHVTARLGGLVIESLEVRGGASDVEISLPWPKGVVPVKISGGVSKVAIRCPSGAQFQAELTGGASELKIGTQRFDAVGGRIHWETPGYPASKDRYEIAITGGASNLTIE